VSLSIKPWTIWPICRIPEQYRSTVMESVFSVMCPGTIKILVRIKALFWYHRHVLRYMQILEVNSFGFTHKTWNKCRLWLFVTLVPEVSLISRYPNFRFERISMSRRFLWNSLNSFPFFTRHNSKEGLVPGCPKLVSYGLRPLFDSVRHFIVKHIPFESVITSTIRILTVHPRKRPVLLLRFWLTSNL
jgi:hypothetical protein